MFTRFLVFSDSACEFIVPPVTGFAVTGANNQKHSEGPVTVKAP